MKAVIDTNILVAGLGNPFKRYQNVEIVRVSKLLRRLEKLFG